MSKERKKHLARLLLAAYGCGAAVLVGWLFYLMYRAEGWRAPAMTGCVFAGIIGLIWAVDNA